MPKSQPQSQQLTLSNTNNPYINISQSRMNSNIYNQQQQQPVYGNPSPVPQFTTNSYGVTTGFRPCDSISISPIQSQLPQQPIQQSYQPPIQHSVPQAGVILPPIYQPVQQPIQPPMQQSIQQSSPYSSLPVIDLDNDENGAVRPRSYQYEFYKQCVEVF